MADKLEEADVAAAWNRNAERWSEDVRAGYDLYRDVFTLPAFLACMPEIAGCDVIDLGCGEGSNTRRMADVGGRMTGIDISEALIARAREDERREPRGIRYELGSFSQLDFLPHASFDHAVSTMALMDGPDLAGAMREAWRVLRPGGTFTFSVLHPCFVTPVLKWLRDENGNYEGLRVGRYFDRDPFVERWRFSKRPDPQSVELFEVPRFPRTLSDYLNAISDAGFHIARLEEPRPDATMARNYTWLTRWRDHAALVLFVLARKS
jgi:ubiquinone/menaquinone biosynthesis C-methylase UbiE